MICQSTAQQKKQRKTRLDYVPLLLPLPGLLQITAPWTETRVLSITDAPFNH